MNKFPRSEKVKKRSLVITDISDLLIEALDFGNVMPEQ